MNIYIYKQYANYIVVYKKFVGQVLFIFLIEIPEA